MKIILHITLTILLQSILHFCIAQNNQFQFNLVEGNDGKPLRKITAIAQDPNGYMWFAGQGAQCLYRYDGSSIKMYAHDSSNSNSIGSSNLETVYADDQGYIWIGFGEGGLDQFNPATGIFKHFRYDPSDPGSLGGNLVSSILRDSKGRLWVGTNGLDRLDETTGKFIHYTHDSANPRSLSSNIVNKIYEDRNGAIWVGTGFSWFKKDPEDGGLNKLEGDGTFTRYMHDPKNPHSLINNKVRAIFEDSRGVFWVGTNSDGLHTMDRATGRFQRHKHNPAKPDQLSRPPLTKEDMNDPITFIHEDISGAIWIATRLGGINRYDTLTQKVTNFKNSNGFPDESGWNAFSSRDGVLWISTEGENLYRIDPTRKAIRNNLGHAVNNFLEDKNGNIWAGTDGRGLWQYDEDNKLIHQFVSDPEFQNSLFNDDVRSLYQSGPDSIWFGTFRGMGVFNTSTKLFSRFSFDTSIKEGEMNPVTSIFRDKSGKYWFTRLGGPTSYGLVLYDPQAGSIKTYKNFPDDSSAISSSMIHSGIEDASGDIWTGTGLLLGMPGGINRLNRQTGKFTRYLVELNVGKIYEDFSGTIWAGSEKGLFRYDRKANRFNAFFDPQSAISEAGIKSITEDDEKNLWVSTSFTLVKINPERNKSTHYGQKFGVIPNFLYGDILKKSNGEILVGNKNGFYSFYPHELVFNVQPSVINITGVFINNLPFPDTTENPSFTPVEKIRELSLAYNQNNISIKFAVTDYRSPESIKYFTRLMGFDSVWHETGAEKSAYYYHVSPGDYVFQIKAFDSEGIQLEKWINIHIDIPWWKTWWAYLMYILLSLAAIIIIYQIQKQRIIQKERQKTQAIELAQAKEIEKAYHELRSTQAQLIQSEKMASLGELTAGIAHEIQNPLNFVNNFSEVSTELIAEMKAELKKGKIEEAIEIADDIDQNLEKINHHGKRADAIVKGMLQHSRTSSGQKEPTDINDLADEYLRLSFHGLRAKDKAFNATLKTDFDSSMGQVNVIPQDIGRVLLNLFNNAFYAVTEKFKLKPEGYEPTVTVSTKKIGSKIEIRVGDNGNGIPANVKEKIFQPFFTTKPTGQGTGLGLSLSYDIIKAHHGEFKVETKEGEWTEFIIELPFAS